MWIWFGVAVFVGLVFLYAPGFLMLRACRVQALTSLTSAPLVTLPACLVICVLFEKVGAFSSWVSVMGLLLAFGVIALVVSHFVGGGRVLRFDLGYSPDAEPGGHSGRERALDWALLGLYVLVGVVVATFAFAYALDGPESLAQSFDNVHHLNTTRAFVGSGNWSPLCVSQYLTAEDIALNPLPGASYYPSAWSVLSALLVSALGVSPVLASNAVNFLFVAVVYPVCMFMFMKVVFPKSPGVEAAGALCVLGFGAFPWMLMVLGPLYPNMIGFCLVPSVAFCFISIFSRGVDRLGRVTAAILLVFGVVCCGFTQPNAVFTVAVLLAPFCVKQAIRLADHLPFRPARPRLAKVGLACGACALIAAAWYALYKMPFLQGVVSYTWPPLESVSEALMDAALLGFRAPGAQVVLAGLVVVGAVRMLRHKKQAWLVASYALAVFIWVASISCEGELQHVMSGFWYTDSARTAAMAALIAVPLASVGLWEVVRLCQCLVEKVAAKKRESKALQVGCVAAVACAFVLANYFPGLALPNQETKQTAFAATLFKLQGEHATQAPNIYSADERSFVETAMSVIPAGAVVINSPDDGSALSYGISGMRTYYRYLRPYGEEGETDESKLIRTRLNTIATDENVRAAVERVGGAYVLALDQGPSQLHSPRWYTYGDGELWRGIELIDDETPGFEVVLADGDKRLYKIVGKGE